MLFYDPEKPTILEGFGITNERRLELVEHYIHGSRGDILARICNDESLAPNEKFMLLVEVGCKLVENTIDEMAKALTEKGV